MIFSLPNKNLCHKSQVPPAVVFLYPLTAFLSFRLVYFFIFCVERWVSRLCSVSFSTVQLAVVPSEAVRCFERCCVNRM